MKYIEIQKVEDSLIITISRPVAMNALNLEVLKELKESFSNVDVDNTRCVILTGAGKKAFVAGADIGLMEKLTKNQAKDFSSFGTNVFRTIETFHIPVIAAINGYALGGGLELALACDIRIASANAVFGLPELGFGIIPGFGGTQRLMRTIPAGWAKEMIYASTKIDSTRALQLGLINSVCQSEELMDHALMIAKRITRNTPNAMSLAKKAMNDGSDERIIRGLDLESDLFAQCFENKEQTSRMKAFLEKSKRK